MPGLAVAILCICVISVLVVALRLIPGAVVIENGKVKMSLWLFLAIIASAGAAIAIWVGWFGLLAMGAGIAVWLTYRHLIYG